MVMKPVCYIIVLLAIILISCYTHYKYHQGTFPENPVNMEDFNSEYDDYNSTSPDLGAKSAFIFSSNRNSEGKNFDIIYKMLDVTFSKSTGILTIRTGSDPDTGMTRVLTEINTPLDELGPCLIPDYDFSEGKYTGGLRYEKAVFLYASNDSGNLDIRFTQNLSGDSFSAPKNITFLNSDKEDAYPTLNQDNSAIYFCSNRKGDFDIFRADIPLTGSLVNKLSNAESATITREAVLSSGYNDKCPFIIRNLMVFVSDRPGGFGGLDLYYSTFRDGGWTAPVNFGDKINTQYDEYRPIVKTYWNEFTNDLMIFSSNRPGGKGGFDLYYVGIDYMTN
jgi:WD40-like Beta Propeller Repeat